ncbi:MAG: hypothetical protein K0U76_11990 [Actinomycetia bacterium]|nr:hypothetical protein [Actinomycetes bacterium]MCH9761007.1 hypothetical protein [Actinomycetes bacterium]
MDAVLGLSVTPSGVGLVVVQGQDADAATMEGTGFEVDSCGSSSALQTSEQAAAAVLRAQAIAAGRGQRMRSIGVTWSDEADPEASLLLKSLSDSGFDNIVPVRLSEASDALARGIAELTDYRTTAVCVIEPEQLIAMVVRTDVGAVQTAVNHTVVTEEDLVGWLSAVFARADWQPEALVLVGSAEDLDGLRPVLEEALSVPVFSPATAQLALARGAALACAQNIDFRFDGAVREAEFDADAERPMPVERRARRLSPGGAATLLAAGVVTLVASASAALALQAAPERAAPQPRPATEAFAHTPPPVGGTAPTAPKTAPVLEAAPLPAPEVGPAQAPERVVVPQAKLIVRQAPMADATPPEESATFNQRTRQRITSFGDDAVDDQDPPFDIAPPPLP